MRILAIADAEDNLLLEWLSRREPSCRYDLVVSCGDLSASYLDTVATLTNAPLVYVRGNHDAMLRNDFAMGGIDLDGRIVCIAGLRLAGLEGSLDYRACIVGYSQAEMRHKALRLGLSAALTAGVDVLVTHAPPRGYGDLPDVPHQGFEAFNGLLMWTHPRLMLHGHVHLNYGRIDRELSHPSGTRLVNVYGWQEVEL